MKNENQAALLKEKAVQGDIDAQFELAMAYYQGDKIDSDYYQAFKWFQKAAKNNHSLSQVWLGSCYHNGLGVEQDFSLAKKWYMQSVEQGEALASYLLAQLYFEETEGRVCARTTEILELISESAVKGLGEAQAFFAWAYSTGYGLSVDPEKAFYWWMKAVEQGIPEAMYSLGKSYFDGEGVKADKKEAYYWFYLAKHFGEEESISELNSLDFGLSEKDKQALEKEAIKSIKN